MENPETIALFTLTSSLHAETAVDAASEPFILDIESALGRKFEFHGDDFTTYGTHAADIIYVRTGGTEGLFKTLGLDGDITLLTSGKSNSLAASMEILSFLRTRGRHGEILHGTPESIAGRIMAGGDRRQDAGLVKPFGPVDLGGMRLGVIGRPSDWLISSGVDYDAARALMNVELVDIPMSELLSRLPQDTGMKTFAGSEAIHNALKDIVGEYDLAGLTLRCFDLLDTVHNTGCLALARLNADGIPAACEGDVPALLSMAYLQKTVGCPGFQCNLSRIDGDNLLFAHCTVPLNMVSSFHYDTHFESGMGTAIKGELPCTDAVIFKISPDLQHCVSIPCRIVGNTSEAALCRTQIMVSAPGAGAYFLQTPLANHHIVSLCPPQL